MQTSANGTHVDWRIRAARGYQPKGRRSSSEGWVCVCVLQFDLTTSSRMWNDPRLNVNGVTAVPQRSWAESTCCGVDAETTLPWCQRTVPCGLQACSQTPRLSIHAAFELLSSKLLTPSWPPPPSSPLRRQQRACRPPSCRRPPVLVPLTCFHLRSSSVPAQRPP